MDRENSEKLFIVLCCICGKRRGTDGEWFQCGGIPHQSDTVVHSHGICPGCSSVFYGSLPAFGKGETSHSED